MSYAISCYSFSRESINMSFSDDDCIPFQYLDTLVKVHSSTLSSSGSQFIFLIWNGLKGPRGGIFKKYVLYDFTQESMS